MTFFLLLIRHIAKFVSLLQAAAAPDQQQANIEPMLLSSSPAVKYEVDNRTTHYRQHISYQGGKLQLMVSDVTAEDLPRRDFGNSVSFRLPITAWLRKQLDIIEEFVRDNIDLASLPASSSTKTFVYKPLWRGHQMFVNVSPRCSFQYYNSSTAELQSADLSSMHGKGRYSFTISVPYIYIGPHKKGEDYSLSLEIMQMIFYPHIEIEAIPSKPTKRRRPKLKLNVPVAQVETKF